MQPVPAGASLLTFSMKPRVVVTGIGVVSPNGIGRESFWQATRNGVSGIRRISVFDPSGISVQIAGEVTDFDETQHVPEKERKHLSRVVPLGIAAISEALADAGIDPKNLNRDQLRRIGVLVGSGGGSAEFVEEQYRLYYESQQRQVSVYGIPSATIGTMASEFSMRYGFRGPSHVVSTGCTSSTDAIGYACQHIASGNLDYMVAGGVDAPIAPLIIRCFMLMRILTSSWNRDPARASRPFSRDRDGFVIAEGSWFFVLESYEHAKARGAHIYGEIAGYASTCEAYHRVQLEECGEEPAETIKMALANANIDAGAIDYLNYHGTSTKLNDRIETRAIKLAFNSHAFKLPGSSVKSLIGHPQGASGAAGLACTLLAMRDGVLPPTANVEHPDPECDLDYVSDTGRKKDLEWAVCNCIAFGSKNSALVVRKVA
jgi:3-oxoacyl-[acyl-carrier-protein] synthase II